MIRLAPVLLVFVLTACATTSQEGYNIPLRSPQEVNRELKSACTSAAKKGAPILVEFSAEWCNDCKKLHEMKKEPVLANELKRWNHVVVNISRFDQHEMMLDKFEIERIANWTILDSGSCADPVTDWQLKAQRTLEPEHGDKVTEKELADWLAKLRG